MRDAVRFAGWATALLLVFAMMPAPSAYAVEAHDNEPAPVAVMSHPPTSKPATGYIYTVQASDTLWGIASAHGVTVSALIAANTLPDPRLLRPGQKLFIPAPRPAIPRAPAPPPAPAPVMTAAPGQTAANAATLPPDVANWPQQLLAQINTDRAAHGIPALALSPELTRAAQAHAQDCALRNAGSHIGSDGARLRDRLARVNHEPRWASENWANARDVAHAYSMWWNEAPGSDPHHRNILDPRYSEIGIGVARGTWGYYFIADFGGW